MQAPFYDLKQDRAENFGGIGTVIAHEISHAFDNNGAQFDEFGNMKNWWTEEDFAEFNKRTQAEIDLFDGIKYGPVTLNGKQIVSENIADQGGLTAAIKAAKDEGDDLKKLLLVFGLTSNLLNLLRHKFLLMFTHQVQNVQIFNHNVKKTSMKYLTLRKLMVCG